jgi:acyl-CoA reductase-like NAD-dependent aldehyde dehydrogenase
MTGARRLSARDPRTGCSDYAFEAPTREALLKTSEALRAAQPGWLQAGFKGRGEALGRLAQALAARRADLVAALELDTGRRRIAGTEVDSVVGSIAAWRAIAAGLVAEPWTPGRAAPHIRHTAQRVPYPLVGVISPWNFPLLLAMIDTIPALMAGCAVLLKPSEVTPRFVAPLREIVAEAGLDGVLAIVAGDAETGRDIVDVVDCVCFTGSVATGRKVAVAAAGRLIPAFLELGGKDPLIVLDGADLDAATDAALRGSVVATGQACQSIERIHVARAIYPEFLDRLVAKASAARLNWPDIAVGDIGPIIFAPQAEVLSRQIADAVAKGGRVLTGGTIERHGGGLWLRPTVIADAKPDMLLMTEETFGPILPVSPFDTIDEAVALANAGEFGLSAAVFAATLNEAEAVGRRIEAGAISLNDAALTALFYEAAKQSFKASGLGPSRMGAEGLTRFTRRKALIANTARPVPLAAFREDQ